MFCNLTSNFKTSLFSPAILFLLSTLFVALGCSTGEFSEQQDETFADGGEGEQDEWTSPVVDEQTLTADYDNDGISPKNGDCNDHDPMVGPLAMEVPGIACTNDKDCPSPVSHCLAGYCRCASETDCSSQKPCEKNEDCSDSAETCKGGKCISTYKCLAAQKGMSSPEFKVCRDNTDNDCDKQIDELPGSCDALNSLDQQDPLSYAKAIELCDSDITCDAENACPGGLKCTNGHCSRVLSATFNADADARARAIAAHLAKNSGFSPKAGQSMIVLSTGLADYDINLKCPNPGTRFGNVGEDPEFKDQPDNKAKDLIQFSVELLVPANANSFSFDFNFFSGEYPIFLDSKFNDTFWAELKSSKLTGNVAFDQNKVPIRIRNAFFSICQPSPQYPKTKSMCTKPDSLLKGTGFKDLCPIPNSRYDTKIQTNGGATDWLFTKAPVTPGEKITLVFSIFDKGDFAVDSTVLIDNFRWHLNPTTKPITAWID